LWQRLRNRQLNGHKFSRQMPLGPYFCDFLCRERMFIVELDGVSHDASAEYDARRDTYCRSLGYDVMRIQNVDVMTNIEGVLHHIAASLAQLPTPNPSRTREGRD
jgi:very-short-patch-repair endonuclease